MTSAELDAELERLKPQLANAKRVVKGVMGQQRLAIQLLAHLHDEISSLQARLDERTATEAEHGHERATAAAR